jgi:hypothetical protein
VVAKTSTADRQRHWREAIERQQASGQSIVGFCGQEGLSLASFHAWKRRFRRPKHVIRRKEAKEPLVPVQIVSDQASGVGNLEVQWPSGIVLRAQGCDVQTISAALTALSTSPSTRRTRRC